jgi:mRNA-degrading endonuclease RelE of RelBE toxin-antitoxin system
MVVFLTSEAQEEADELPLTMRARLDGVIARLERWPNVSGHKALSGAWRDHYRVRMGDWRVVFHVMTSNLIVVRIMHRREVYDE